MNAKELVTLLNENNLSTWRPKVYSMTPQALLALRREMQQGLSRVDRNKIIDPYSEDPKNKVKNKGLNYISFIEHAFRIKMKHVHMKKNIDNAISNRMIEEQLLKNAY